MYTVLHNCLEDNNDLKLQIGGEHFFDEPFIKYFKKFLDLNSKVQLIVDTHNRQTWQGALCNLSIAILPGNCPVIAVNLRFSR